MTARALALPLAALVLAAALLGVYAAAGGGSYAEVQGAADPCRQRPSAQRPVPAQLEPLAERVVLIGLDETACELGVSRERLVLALPVARDRRALAAELGVSEAELGRELKAGLVRAVDRLDRAGRLPAASELLPAVVAELDLPGPARRWWRRSRTTQSIRWCPPGRCCGAPCAGWTWTRCWPGWATPTGWRRSCVTRCSRPRWRRSGRACWIGCR